VTSFPVQTYNAPWFVKPKSRPVPQHTYVLSEDDSTFFPNYSNPLMFVFTNNGSKNQYVCDIVLFTPTLSLLVSVH
jgi:hypothetical protein